MIFKGVRDGKPYPEHGLSYRDWSQIPPQQIRLDELVTTTTVLALDRLLSEDSTFYGDLFPHAVRWQGRHLPRGRPAPGGAGRAAESHRVPCPGVRHGCAVERADPGIGFDFRALTGHVCAVAGCRRSEGQLQGPHRDCPEGSPCPGFRESPTTTPAWAPRSPSSSPSASSRSWPVSKRPGCSNRCECMPTSPGCSAPTAGSNRPSRSWTSSVRASARWPS